MSRSARGSPSCSALSVGSAITDQPPQGRTTPFGTVPRIVDYTVAAIFEVGVYDYDKAFVVMPMEDAQTLLMLGDAVGMIEVDDRRSPTGSARSSRRSPRSVAGRGDRHRLAAR